ncbi:hypothetical protein PNOK_0367000 [Pyrrhoderma noxium]|uniref:Uncharacterized protein n=1 Tax=Pyrrhoderma noxium TaxID=2282107 RepID=A0A286UN73_9AGAM|nr:hypothetical protein PNOK_0367000 [Pyrrhoderma noxium]
MKGHTKNGCSQADEGEQSTDTEIQQIHCLNANDNANRGQIPLSNGPTVPFNIDAGPSKPLTPTNSIRGTPERTISPPARWEQWKSMWPMRLNDQRPVMPGAFANDRPSIISVPLPLKERIGPKIEEVEDTRGSIHSLRATPIPSDDEWNLVPPGRERYVSAPLQEIPAMHIQQGIREGQNGINGFNLGSTTPQRPRFASESLPRTPKALVDRLSGPRVGTAAYDNTVSDPEQETYSDSDSGEETEIDAGSDTRGSVILNNISNIAGSLPFLGTHRYRQVRSRPLRRNSNFPSTGSLVLTEMLAPGAVHDVKKEMVSVIQAMARRKGLMATCLSYDQHQVSPELVRLRIEHLDMEDRYDRRDRRLRASGRRHPVTYENDYHYRSAYQDEYTRPRSRSHSPHSNRSRTPRPKSSTPTQTPIPMAPHVVSISPLSFFFFFLSVVFGCVVVIVALSYIP